MDDFSGLTGKDILKFRSNESEGEEEADGPKIEEDTIREETKRERSPVSEYSSDETPLKSLTQPSTSTNSSTSSSTDGGSSAMMSLRDYQFPQCNYERDLANQLMVAVIGREFDDPQSIVSKLRALVPMATSDIPLMKLIPFTVKRSVLVKANFNIDELRQLDLVCMCYNASEARLMLTGRDGFYTQLTKRLESLLGSNKVAFLITNYMYDSDSTHSLINPALRTRLMAQVDLNKYLDANQVLSWYHEPHDSHVTKLIEMAKSEPNPINSCVII